VHSLFEANAYGGVSQEGQRSLQMAQESTERLIRLVNNLLDIEKLESGSISVQIGNHPALACFSFGYGAESGHRGKILTR
jgi:signal transduction histidine kinase